jgi:hypothetical protein
MLRARADGRPALLRCCPLRFTASSVDLNGTARLTGGPGKTDAGPFPARQIVTLTPGQSGNITFGPPKSLPNGPWQVKVSLVSGLTTAAATATIAFAAVVPAQAGLSFAAWLGLALGVMAVALIVAALALRHRRATARHSGAV